MTPHDHDHATEDPLVILLGFVAAAGFGSGAPLLGLVGLLACVGHITAKIDPESLPARLLTSGQAQAQRLTSAAREHVPALPAYDDPPTDLAQDIFGLLTSERHVLIVGHTGGGKSTLLHALAARFGASKASVLVIDVDSVAGRYPGYRVVGSGDDYPAAQSGLVVVKRELQRRRAARKEGVRDFPRMVLLIDETQDVVREIESGWPIIEDVIRRGRKVNVWCVIAAQDSQVNTLNLKGKSHLLGNLTRVDVQRRGGQRVADAGGYTYQIPTLRPPDELVQSKAEQSAQTGLKEATPDHQSTALLTSLLGAGLGQSEGQSGRSEDEMPDRSKTAPDRSEIVAVYRQSGSKNKVYEWLRDTYGIRAKPVALKLINDALEQQGSDDDDDDPPPAFGWLAE